MFSLQDLIRYVGLAAIIFFLIKAFANNKLNNKQIIFLVIAITLIVIFLICQYPSCRKTKEPYQITDPPLVDSIYPGPDNTEYKADQLEKLPPMKEYVNEDMQNSKDIAGIDKELYHRLMKQEKKAMNKIRDNYRDQMVYTTTHPFNTVPLGTQLYGYTYLPPENWFRAYDAPPVCITDKKCPVCPILDTQNTSELMEFDTANNVMGPDGIDLRFVKKVLNKGRSQKRKNCH